MINDPSNSRESSSKAVVENAKVYGEEVGTPINYDIDWAAESLGPMFKRVGVHRKTIFV